MWEIRRASLADRDRLVELCAAAVGPDDYPIGIMEDMILHGAWNIAFENEKVVGAMHYTDAVDGSGWLAAARTHPAYRRRGIASALGDSFVRLAERKAVPALRLWSAASNVDGTSSARAMGFREVARFTRVRRMTARPFRRAPPADFTADLLSQIQASPLLRKARGYVPFDGYFLPLSPANANLLCNRRALRRIARGLACLSGPGDCAEERTLGFGLVAGHARALLRAMPGVGAALGCDEVVSFLPHNARILAAAKAAGFSRETWGQEAILFERLVDARVARRRTRRTYAELAAERRGGVATLPPSSAQHAAH